MRCILAICFSFCLGSCANLPYSGAEVVGPDAFVMDSYKIREGKWSMLDMEGLEVPSLSAALLEPYANIIQNGDVMHVKLFHETRHDLVTLFSTLSQGFCVQEGFLYLPDVPPVYIEGLTIAEAEQSVQETYRKQVQDVIVTLSFQERAAGTIQLAGIVQLSTLQADGKIRLFEALSLAKVPPQANLFRSYLVRDGKMLPVDFYRLIKEGDMTQNVVLRNGDMIYVADAADTSLYVLGEVGRECALAIPNGFMSLRTALAEAGGIPYTGDKAYIQVLRGNVLHPKVYTLHWQHIIRLPTESLLLMPGDIVYVAARPLKSWNRCITQILPTLIGIDLLTKGAKTIGINVP